MPFTLIQTRAENKLGVVVSLQNCNLHNYSVKVSSIRHNLEIESYSNIFEFPNNKILT